MVTKRNNDLVEILSSRPEKSKRITDPSFLIVLAICIAGMIYLAYFCFLNGRPLRYIYGSDSFGNVCGRDDNSRISGVELSGLDMSGNKLLLSLGLDSESGLKKSSLCVKSCPTGQMTCEQMLEANGYQLSADSLMRKRICGSSLKMGYFVDSDKRCLVVKENKGPIHQGSDDDVLFYDGTTMPATTSGVVYSSGVQSDATEHGRGKDILPEDTDILGEISQFLIKFTDTSVRCVLKHWKSMMCTCCMTAAICFVLVLLFQTIPRVTIILMLGTFTLTFAAVTGFLIYCTVVNWPAQETEPTPELESVPEYDKYEVFKAFIIPLHIRLVIGAVLTGVITLAIVFSIVWNRKTIGFLIDLNIEVAAMIREIPTINFQPILTILFQVAIFVYFVSVLLFMLTTDTPAPDQDNMVINIASPVVRTLSLLAVHLISCLWLSAFVDGCHQAVVSGTMSWFIFYQATASTCSLCFPTIIPLLGIVGRSLGSITLASVVVPITRIPRFAFSLMGRILKPNMRIPLEHVLEPLSARAYIRIGMYGEGFIQAGTVGFTVLYSFAPKSMALLKKNRFYLHIGKFAACVFASLTAMLWIYFCLEIEPTKHIDVVATLVIPAFGLAYITASCFINFSHVIAETLFMCYCYDRQLNDESVILPNYVSDRFEVFIQKYNAYFKRSGTRDNAPEVFFVPVYDIEAPRKKLKRPRAARGKRTRDDGTKSISPQVPFTLDDLSLNEFQVVDSFDRLVDKVQIERELSPLRDKMDDVDSLRPVTPLPPIHQAKKPYKPVIIPSQILEGGCSGSSRRKQAWAETSKKKSPKDEYPVSKQRPIYNSPTRPATGYPRQKPRVGSLDEIMQDIENPLEDTKRDDPIRFIEYLRPRIVSPNAINFPDPENCVKYVPIHRIDSDDDIIDPFNKPIKNDFAAFHQSGSQRIAEIPGYNAPPSSPPRERIELTYGVMRDADDDSF